MQRRCQLPARRGAAIRCRGEEAWGASRRGRLDAFDLAVLLAFALLSVWLLSLLVWYQRPDHMWIGTDGPVVGDQVQYLAWIRESARHVLIANPFKLESSAASFLHPGLVLSGAATHVGVAPWIAYLIWKPVAVVALFVAVRAAALAYARPTRDFQGVAVRVWAPAAIAIYGLIGNTRVGTFPLHALQGLSIPFAVLAVAGAGTVLPRSRPAAKVAIGAFLVALLTVLALARELNRARTLATARDPIAVVFGAAGAFVNAGEGDAFDYLEGAPDRGGVLANRRLGQMVPAESGRHTWVGLPSWTPDVDRRARLAHALLAGQLAPRDARLLVRSSGARFVLSDCLGRDLSGALRPMLLSVRHFGCTTVYRVRR
jgi:hypothetical protein